MRIAIMGAGAVGGYFGGLLARAGHEVAMVARGPHLQAMREHGLALEGPRGRIEIAAGTIEVTDDPARLAPCDVVLFCVKTYDTETAAASVRALVGKGGLVISLQNGIDGQERIGAVLGSDRVLGGLALVSALIETPGVIRYVSDMSALRFGEADGTLSARALAFASACESAGFRAEVMADIRAAQWRKFVGLATNAALTCLFRLPAGYIYHDPDLIPMARAGFAEVFALAQAQGIDVGADAVDNSLKLHQQFPGTMYASMYHDLARGKPLEVDSLSGVVMRRGRALGVATPFHEMAWRCLKPYARGTPAPLGGEVTSAPGGGGAMGAA